MDRKAARLVRAAEVSQGLKTYQQRMNPRSKVRLLSLTGLAGFQRLGVDLVRVPPGHESFSYHAHLFEEEWLYVLEGEGVARVDGVEHALHPGDFLGFPAPQVAHVIINRGTADFVFLEGGEKRQGDVIDYPDLGKRYVLLSEEGKASFYPLGAAEHHFSESE